MINNRFYSTTEEHMRLDKYLADAGVGTRQTAKMLIKSGVVAVNGETVTDAGTHISETDMVTADGEPVRYRRHRYYMLNKPAGYLTANDDANAPTVLDLFPEELRHRIFAVGRLDKDTRGLLLLTDDGALGHLLTSPKRAVEKVYRLETDLPMTEADVTAIGNGMTLQDETTFRPARLSVDPGNPRRGQITLTEGKYHAPLKGLRQNGR